MGRDSFYGVQDAGGIIHHAEGIGEGREVVLLEAASHLVGKARAHAEHPLGRTYAERRLRQRHDSTEYFFVHVCKVTNK